MELRRTPLIALTAACVFAIFTALLISPVYQEEHNPSYQSQKEKTFRAPKHNIWSELTEHEANEVYDFLFHELSYLNLTKRPESNRDNFIFIVETLRPNKTDAASYIYEDAVKPQRWAKAAVAQTFDDGPYMVYYAIGPLPISSQTQVLPLEYIFNNGRNYVKNPVQDFYAIMEWGISLAESISDITQELLGATANRNDPIDPNGLQCWPRGSRVDTGGMMLWFQIYRPGLGSGGRTLLPQGIYAKVDATSTNVSDWSAGEFYYNGILHANVQEFRDALKDPSFVSTPSNDDGDWTNTEDFDSQPHGRDLPPPVSVQPYGPRYRLDRAEHFISWFGFEFYITTAQATGISLFDVRFKGERVMYEVGLQEALAHYAGDDPMQGGLEFLDTFFGMGKQMYELVPGYDCPAYAD